MGFRGNALVRAPGGQSEANNIFCVCNMVFLCAYGAMSRLKFIPAFIN